jgi:hypothetical protein
MRAGILAPVYLRGAALIIGGAGAILALAGVSTSIRGPAVLVFLVTAPALAVAGLLSRVDPVARGIVAVTAAIAINVLVAEAMLAANTWSPRTGLVAIAIISALIGLIGFRSRHGRFVPAWAGRSADPGGGISGRS